MSHEDMAARRRRMLEDFAANPRLQDMAGEPEAGKWYRRRMDGCINAGGSENWAYIKKGASENLIVFFVGGGFAVDEETARGSSCYAGSSPDHISFYTDACHPNNEFYFFHALGQEGLLSLEEKNPFRDWSIVMINYGTADIHIGDADFPWTDREGQPHQLHHHGYRNFKHYMALTTRLFPDPQKLLVTGVSAGGFAAAALAADVAEFFPNCRDITVCPDSAYLKYEKWPHVVKNVWKAPPHLADKVTSDNIVLDLYSATQQRLGDRAKYMFICGYPDGVLGTFQNYFDTGSFTLTEEAAGRMAENLKEHIKGLKAMGQPLSIFLHNHIKNGGVQHCILDSRESYLGEVSAIQWLYDGVNGRGCDVGLELMD